jgi:hypothetical protein
MIYFKTNKSPVHTFLNKYKIGCVVNLDDVEDLEFVVVADLDDVVELAHDCRRIHFQIELVGNQARTVRIEFNSFYDFSS